MTERASFKTLLDEAARAYAVRSRPSMASCLRVLQAMVCREDADRAEEGLPPLRWPTRWSLERAIHDLDPYEVYAARHGLAAARRRFLATRGRP